MPESKVQVFVSYAHLDNQSRTGIETSDRFEREVRNGFVDFLHCQLKCELQELGDPWPRIWRDPRIGAADQFGPMIEEAIAGSSLFVVIMSRNWLASDYCRAELKCFAERWKSEGESALRRRFVVVNKQNVPRDRYPALLQGQRGVDFFAHDEMNEGVPERGFFARGEITDKRYMDRLRELAVQLWNKANRLDGSPSRKADNVSLSNDASVANRRTIFVAKPASDMRKPYDRVVEELIGRGYTVVPDPQVDVPSDSVESAVAMIDEALQTAEVSVHLLGRNFGFKPDGSDDPIAKIQLKRAAAKTPPFVDASDTRRGFHRIIWAPKIVEAANGAGERDPVLVLNTFDQQHPADCIDGDTISNFVEFLQQHLLRTAPAREAIQKIEAQSKVYIYHRLEDTDYANDIARALLEQQVQPMLPAFDDTPAAQLELHRQYLRSCDSVMICWASAPEVWAKARSHELVDWSALGRTTMFSRRGLVAGPPPGVRKKTFIEFFPKSEIDVIIDLTERDKFVPADLTPFISPG